MGKFNQVMRAVGLSEIEEDAEVEASGAKRRKTGKAVEICEGEPHLSAATLARLRSLGFDGETDDGGARASFNQTMREIGLATV